MKKKGKKVTKKFTRKVKISKTIPKKSLIVTRTDGGFNFKFQALNILEMVQIADFITKEAIRLKLESLKWKINLHLGRKKFSTLF